MTAAAGPVWAARRDGNALQEFLKERGCDGVDAVRVTMQVVGCGLGDAQRMFFSAPCRAVERDFHNAFLEGLEQSQDEGLTSSADINMGG